MFVLIHVFLRQFFMILFWRLEISSLIPIFHEFSIVFRNKTVSFTFKSRILTSSGYIFLLLLSKSFMFQERYGQVISKRTFIVSFTWSKYSASLDPLETILLAKVTHSDQCYYTSLVAILTGRDSL
jgi:hypothetical protein